MTGQACLQVLQALNGLLFVWLLGVEDFAVYAVFTGAMGFCALVMGVGITPTMISLIGADFENKAKVGRYLTAALRLRFIILLPISLIGVALLTYSGTRIGYPGQTILLVSAALIGCNIFSAQNDLYGAPLQIARRLGALYQFMILGEMLKLLVATALWTTGWLTAVGASFATLAGLGANFYGVRRLARGCFIKPDELPMKEVQEMWHLVSPNLPNALFGAFQGQIAIIVGAMFGSSVQVASIGALSRLSRLLTFLQAANPMLLGPALAKLSAERFWKVVPLILLGAGIIAVGIATVGWVMPQALLLLLGKNYEELTDVVWIVTLGAGIGYFLNVLGSVVSFRHLVAWWVSLSTIALVILSQTMVVLFLDVKTVGGALLLGVAANGARVTMNAILLMTAKVRPNWLRDPKTMGV